MRKIYLVMISLSMIIGTFSFCISNVNAEELSLSYFDLDMYKANLAFKEGNNPINNGIPPYYEVVKTQHNMNHPSGILINGLNKDSSFLVKLKMFDLLTLDPSGLIEELSSESEYYTAILLAMLNISTTSDYRLEAMDSKWVESAKISGGWVLSYFKDEYNITVGLNSKIANIDNNKLKTAFQKLMKDKYNMVNGIDKGIELFDKYVTAMTTLEDIINHITTYINIYQLMDETFCVLDEMKNHTTNLNFKYALNKIVDCKDNTLSTISNCISDCKMDIFKTVYKTVVGKLWDDIALSSPFAPMYIAQKGGKALCDICFSTDQISEQYYKMEVLCSIENALNESVEILGNNYINNKNHNNALIYNHAVDLYYELYSISSDYAIEYADIIYKQSSAGIFLNKDNYNSFVKNVTSLKSIANQTKNSLKENYVYYLEEDYPELYREYMGSINDSKIVKVTGITIDADELEWGTDDMFNQIAYEIIPSNATNKKVTMTSSNENIVTITNNGSYIVKNPGEVTITFTTADGNFQDSVRIKAVKGHGKDGILIGDTISVETSGKCGEHVYYKLYDNGTLYIYGSGRMRNYISLYSICEKIKNVIIADGVTSIGNNIFDGCINLVNIVIPYSVTSIEYSAFFNCSSLTSITVPNSVTSIGSGAFSGCSGLTSITVPNSVTSLGSGAFSGCSGLTSITISDNVTSIGSEAFRGCSSLTSITIPNSVTSIGNGAFRYCSSLTSITIPNSVTSIGDEAFRGCGSLASITIPSSVTSIGSRAFRGCRGLTNITVPNNVTSIGNEAFSGCSDLTSIIIPKSVINIGDSIFANCSSLTNITIPDGVTSIGNEAFEGCSSLTSITIPNSVTSIGSGAFRGCSGLTNITIPDGVTSIGNEAFEGCSGLTNITIPNSMTSIGSGAFRGCSGLTSITIPNSVTSIGNGAFRYCSSLTSITIPNSVTSIGNGAFEGCSSLTNIIIPNSVTTIGDRAFANCSSLTNITISNSVINIGDSIFANCSSLTNITVPDSVTSIERDAFYRCSSLTNIVIPNSVTSIGNGAFSGCSDLTSITIPNSVTSIESGAFSSCSSLISVIISDNITSIGHAVFWQCSSLRSITIPNSVTSIDWEAFYGCRSLRSIIIPDSVKWIDRGAFKRCNSLTAYIYADTYALQYVKDNGIPYKIIGTYIDQQTNIQIDSGTCNNIDETTELQVKYIKEGNEYNEVLKSLSDFNLYDISFYKDDEKVTIDGIATVKIPVGDKDPEKCKVYYYDNGKYVNMNAEYEEGYMVFQTEHFSHYILTEETALEENVLLGDVNEDGNIDFLDAIKVLRYDGELVDLNDNQLLVADVNKDNSVDFLDAIMILRYDAELIEGF